MGTVFGPNSKLYPMSCFDMTQLTMIIVVKIHKFPISIVDENLAISRTQAMKVKMMRNTSPGVHGLTVISKSECKTLTMVSVMKEQSEMVKEN